MEDKWIARFTLLFLILLFLYFVFKKKDENVIGYIGLKNGVPLHLLQTKKKKKRINKTEEMCRDIIQEIYHAPFPSIRPDFLKSPKTKRNLELDCYNSNLKIALEYNGAQHYKYSPHFHKSKKDFYSQVHRDDWKRKKCKELGIILIEIPYWVSPPDLKQFITSELRKKKCL